MTLSSSFLSYISVLEKTIAGVYCCCLLLMSANLPMLNPSKTDFLLMGLPKQLFVVNNPSVFVHPEFSISPVVSACNLGNQFDSKLSLFDHISSITKSCLFHVRDLSCIGPMYSSSNYCSYTIATALIQSKLDYCNSLLIFKS